MNIRIFDDRKRHVATVSVRLTEGMSEEEADLRAQSRMTRWVKQEHDNPIYYSWEWENHGQQ